MDVEKWVQESCDRQGVDVKITDPLTLSRVAVLLGVDRNDDDHRDDEGEH